MEEQQQRGGSVAEGRLAATAVVLLVLVDPWTPAGAPPCIRHRGVRCAVAIETERTQVRICGRSGAVCVQWFMMCDTCWFELLRGAYSSRLGSRPSRTILALMAMTGTPWERNQHMLGNTCWVIHVIYVGL